MPPPGLPTPPPGLEQQWPLAEAEMLQPIEFAGFGDTALWYGSVCDGQTNGYHEDCTIWESQLQDMTADPAEVYKVRLSNLPLTMTELSMRAMLAEAGLSDDVVALTLQPLGKALISFAQYVSVEQCISHLYGRVVPGSEAPLDALYVPSTSNTRKIGAKGKAGLKKTSTRRAAAKCLPPQAAPPMWYPKDDLPLSYEELYGLRACVQQTMTWPNYEMAHPMGWAAPYEYMAQENIWSRHSAVLDDEVACMRECVQQNLMCMSSSRRTHKAQPPSVSGKELWRQEPLRLVQVQPCFADDAGGETKKPGRQISSDATTDGGPVSDSTLDPLEEAGY